MTGDDAIDAGLQAAIASREEALRLREEAVAVRESLSEQREAAARSAEALAKRRSDMLDEVVRQVREANQHLVVATMKSQSLTEAADRANQLKEDFLAMLSHELRNPLAPIRNAVAVLQRLPSTEPRLVWVHDVISRQLEQMTRLLDDLLDIARINTGKLSIQKRPVALTEFLEQAIEMCRPLIEQRGQLLQFDIPAEPLYLDGDPARLTQVFGNLLHNATKYTPDGGAIWLTAEAADATVVVRVRDNGNGIAAEAQPQIFDLFNQEERSLTSAQGGLGIGLAVVRRLVELHGGSIECSSAGSGLGSEFVVTLPLLR